MPFKTGPLTREELRAIWESALDSGYTEPFLKSGEGEGLEAHSQMWEGLARVSYAVDRTTQSLFLCPWSGQSDIPAAGAANAEVTLSIARTKRIETPIRLAAGQFVVFEEINLPTQTGPVPVNTGRYYQLAEDLIFHSGETGALTVRARALRPGYGYNNPRPGAIHGIQQNGALFENDLASLVASYPAVASGQSASVILTTALQADTPIPEHVGQYFLLNGSSNGLRQGRVSQFVSGPATGVGSVVVVESIACVTLTSVVGTFQVGEKVSFGVIGTGTVLKHSVVNGTELLTYVMGGGSNLATTAVTGQLSGATAVVETVLYEDSFLSEAPIGAVGGISWRALDWFVDFGMTVTNPESPSGGRAAMLDEIGEERGIRRSPGQDDESYRGRLKRPSDVVSPNAIRRAIARVLGDLTWCFDEAGASLRGWFYDGDLSPVGGNTNTSLAVANLNDAYDTNAVLVTTPLAVTYDVGEEIFLESSNGNIQYARGRAGYVGGILVFIITSGYVPTGVSMRVRGVTNGIDTVISVSVPASNSDRALRVWLDYEQFRGFFTVCAPKVSIGEFGFHYDAPAINNAYDAPLANGNFFDGYPWQNAAFYLRVYQAVEAVRMGGVGWELKLCDASCA